MICADEWLRIEDCGACGVGLCVWGGPFKVQGKEVLRPYKVS
jgi:hypothetical protein